MKNKLKIDIPEPIMTLWSLSGMFGSSYFDSEEEMLLAYMKGRSVKKEKRLKVEKILEFLQEPVSDDVNLFNNLPEILSGPLPGVVRYDYLGTFLGMTDVFKETSYGKKGKENVSFISCGVDVEHFSYLVIDPKKGLYWNGEIGDISGLYRGFRERGIEFEDDIYKKEEEFMRKVFAPNPDSPFINRRY